MSVTATTGVAAEREQDRWNLADLYPTTEAFDAARQAFAARLPELEKHRGTLASSPAALKAALDAMYGAARELGRLGSYASQRSDEDTRVPAHLGARQEVQQLATELSARVSWLDPEILAFPAGTTARFLATEPGLAPYRYYLEDLERRRAHTLSPPEEKLLAQAGLVTPGASTIYGILANADLPFPEVTLADGRNVTIDNSGYTRYRAEPNRADRIAVFREFWKTYGAYQRTFGVTLDTQVKRDLFCARSRNYPNCLAAALDSANVPETVYRTLIAEVNRALPTLHRAFKRRGRLLGIDDLAYHDIYPPLVPALDARFRSSRARRSCWSMTPLGASTPASSAAASRPLDGRLPAHRQTLGRLFERRGLRVHLYVLMNYNDDYESVSTLAHEWGHAMHSHLANRAQPYPTADYSIFVAEVASTFNEALLLDRMLKETKSDDEQLFHLGSYLEDCAARSSARRCSRSSSWRSTRRGSAAKR
jgi:oligoendopeptidase F